MYETHRHDLFYITVKYHQNIPNGFQVKKRKRNEQTETRLIAISPKPFGRGIKINTHRSDCSHKQSGWVVTVCLDLTAQQFCEILCTFQLQKPSLTLKTKIAADDTLFSYFYLSKDIRLDASWESSA